MLLVRSTANSFLREAGLLNKGGREAPYMGTPPTGVEGFESNVERYSQTIEAYQSERAPADCQFVGHKCLPERLPPRHLPAPAYSREG